jgi:hypothetical protein
MEDFSKRPVITGTLGRIKGASWVGTQFFKKAIWATPHGLASIKGTTNGLLAALGKAISRKHQQTNPARFRV